MAEFRSECGEKQRGLYLLYLVHCHVDKVTVGGVAHALEHSHVVAYLFVVPALVLAAELVVDDNRMVAAEHDAVRTAGTAFGHEDVALGEDRVCAVEPVGMLLCFK